jgi:hypothetical protein
MAIWNGEPVDFFMDQNTHDVIKKVASVLDSGQTLDERRDLMNFLCNVVNDAIIINELTLTEGNLK